MNNYSYDALGEMTAETQQGQSGGNAVAPKGISFGYDAIGDITSVERYTNLTQAHSPATDAADTTLGYSNLGQLTSIVHGHNGATIEGVGYGYDTLSRVDSISSTIDGNRTNSGYTIGPDNLITTDGIFNTRHSARTASAIAPRQAGKTNRRTGLREAIVAAMRA